MSLLHIAAAAALAAILLHPLFNINALNSEFVNYTKELPLERDHPHILASIHSVSDASISSLCLLRPIAVIPYVCAAGNSSPSLYALLQHQYVIYDLLLRNTPLPYVIADIHSLEGAAQAAIAFDNPQDDEDQVPSDIHLFADIGTLSRALSEALLLVLVHIELGLSRVLFVHDIILFALKPLERSRLERIVFGPRILPLEGLIAILSEALTDSLTHTRSEVELATSITTTLFSALEQLGPLQVRIATRCTEPGASTLCPRVAELFRSKSRLEVVFTKLDELLAVIETDDNEVSQQAAHTTEYSFIPAVLLVKTNRDALEQKLKQVRAAREGGGRVLA